MEHGNGKPGLSVPRHVVQEELELALQSASNLFMVDVRVHLKARPPRQKTAIWEIVVSMATCTKGWDTRNVSPNNQRKIVTTGINIWFH